MSSNFHSEVLNAYANFSEGGWFIDDHEVVYQFKKTPKQSSVLCCVGKRRDGQICVLLTKRSTKVSSAVGEVAFPGGKVEPCDSSLEETALREAGEEVNLSRHQVEVIGYLPFCLPAAGHQYYICSVVLCTLKGEIDQLKNLKANSEVETIFWTPLDFFLNGGSDHWKKSMQFNQYKHTIDFFRYKSGSHTHIIWGMTAKFCIMVAMLVLKQCTHWPESNLGITQFDKEIVYMSYTRLPNSQTAMYRSKL